MADSQIAITAGTGTNVDTRTIGSDHRQVIVMGDPVTADSVAIVLGADPASNDEGLVVRDVNTSAVVSGLSSVRVRDIVTGTITTITGVDRIRNVVDGTLTLVSTVTGVDRVRNLVDGTLSLITAVTDITNTVKIRASDGTFAIFFSPTEPTVLAGGKQGTTTRPLIMNTDGAIKVYDIVQGTITATNTGFNVNNAPSITGITNSIAVHVLSTNGTMAVNIGTIAGSAAVYFSPSRPVVLADSQHTSSIFTVSGSSSAVSVSGLTLVAPSANYSFKVFALQLTTTAQVHVVPKFTNGAGTSPTEYWRYALQAPTAGIAGANLAVTPPGYLFATGTSTTLSLVLDTASLVHYSVSFIKESA